VDYLQLARDHYERYLSILDRDGSYPSEVACHELDAAQVCADIAQAEELRRLRELLLKQTRGGR
jgi:hypothetical protein